MYEDPGWRRVLAMAPQILVSGLRPRPVAARLTPIEVIRLVYIAFPTALFLILVVLPLIRSDVSGATGVTAAGFILAATATASYAAIAIIRDSGRPVSTAEEALDRYRTQMFVLIALAEAVAMVGFVLVFVTGSLTPYLLGLALAIPGFYMAAPSRVSIERFQDRFGDAVNVLAALTKPSATT